jgi:hypothetical protein
MGIQRSGDHPGSIPRNPSGATPISVKGTPLRVIVLPRMDGSVADHGYRAARGQVVFGREGAVLLGPYTEEVEEISGNALPPENLG